MKHFGFACLSRTLIVTTAILAACSSTTGINASDVELEVQAAAYDVGDVIQLVVQNHAAAPVKYSFCEAYRELRSGAEWMSIQPLRLCAPYRPVLKPGAAIDLEFPVSADWQPGEYRISMPVEISGEDVRIHTSTFTVR